MLRGWESEEHDSKKRDEIEKLTAQKKEHYRLAYSYLSIAGGLYRLRDEILSGYVKKSKLENGEYDLFIDYKTALQEIIQRNPEERLTYVLVDESGPDHDKRFTVEVHLNSNVIGTGIGKSKKQAEQEAAHRALNLMGIE